MKIILTGSTGYIGSEVLRQCLSQRSISSIISLSRRELNITHPKLRVILVQDFTHYSSEILSEVAGADACIYCLGTNIPVRSPDMNRKINFDFAIETAKIFAHASTENKIPASNGLRFIYLSGALPEKDPNRSLWFLSKNRKMRGELENALLELSREKKGHGFEVYIARPGFVQPEGAFIRNWLVGKLFNTIMIHHLAASMIRFAMEGWRDVIIENDELNYVGKKLLGFERTSTATNIS